MSGAAARQTRSLPIPEGFEVIPDAVGVGFENATPRVGLVRSQLVNANTIHSQGLDIGGTARFDLADGIRYTISGEGSVLFDLSTTFPGGRKEKYVGTLGNYNLTAGSGTPRWRANVTQTIDIRDAFSLSGTVNYVAGYNLSAEDQGGVRGDGGLAVDYLPENVDGYITVDLVGTVKVTDKMSFYVNVLNVLNDTAEESIASDVYNSLTLGVGNVFLDPRRVMLSVKVNLGK